MKKQANSFPCKKCFIIYSEESGADENFICDDCRAPEPKLTLKPFLVTIQIVVEDIDHASGQEKVIYELKEGLTDIKEAEIFTVSNGRGKNKKLGNPIYRFGQIRNECWNCGNYTSEKNKLKKQRNQKQYYACEYCGRIGHE